MMSAYSELLIKFQPKVIETKEEFDKVFNDVSLLNKEDEDENELAHLLIVLLDEYEKRSIPTVDFDSLLSLDILKHLMESKNVKAADLVKSLTISSGTLSMILNGKRGISKNLAVKFARYFKVDASLFL